jgi:hypothetical protein
LADWDKRPERIADAARRKPFGIAPYGALAERQQHGDQVGENAGLVAVLCAAKC